MQSIQFPQVENLETSRSYFKRALGINDSPTEYADNQDKLGVAFFSFGWEFKNPKDLTIVEIFDMVSHWFLFHNKTLSQRHSERLSVEGEIGNDNETEGIFVITLLSNEVLITTHLLWPRHKVIAN